MRRFVLVLPLLAFLAVPGGAAAARDAAADGSLVVRYGQAPADTPVVALNKFAGSVIGRVVGAGKIIIDVGPNCTADPQVIGAGRPQSVPASQTAQAWTGSDFTFREIGAPGCSFTIVVYSANDTGTGRVFLVAAGHGSVRLAGTRDISNGDGRYSLNDQDFKSLPGTQSPKLDIGGGAQ
jgi:hypothetical protein